MESEQSFQNLSNFNLKRILSENSQRKIISVEGEFKNKEGTAILVLEKKAFSAENVKLLCDNESPLKKEFINDVYGSYEYFPPVEFNGIKTTIIYPATDKHLKKFEKTAVHLIEETEEIYNNIILPHILSRQLSLQWVYNILDHKSETDRIIYENQNPSEGFILLPDLKWDGKQAETLYLLAICRDRNVKSIRDLNEQHLPLLNNILTEGSKAIEEKYNVDRSRLRIYFHYPPSFYHLHVHFTYIDFEAPGINFERAHSLISVINNIRLVKEYYSRSTLLIPLKEAEEDLFLKLKEAANILRMNDLKISTLFKKVKIEARENLGVCQFYFFFSSSECLNENSFSFTVYRNKIEVSSLVLSLPFNVQPQSLCGLHYSGNSLTFRIHLEKASVRLCPVPLASPSFHLPEITPQIETEKSYMLQCLHCSKNILYEPVKITRIILEPMNSTDISDIFCHRTKEVFPFERNDNNDLQQSIYFDVGSFKLPFFNESNIVATFNDNIIYCERCFYWLGLRVCNKGCTLFFWDDTVKFSTAPDLKSSNISKLILYKIIEKTLIECLFPICNIMLVCKVAAKKERRLLLTILDRNLLIWECTNTDSNFKKVSYLKLLFEEVDHDNWDETSIHQSVLVSKSTFVNTFSLLHFYSNECSSKEKVVLLPV